VSYIATNDLENALADINRALTLNDRYAEAWVNHGLIFEQRNERRKAFKSYSRAANLDRDYKPARDGMSRTRS
jgi:Tfp pilus assembly protein PilF